MTTTNLKQDITTTPEWKNMTWQQKREERFKVWLNPENANFVSPEAGGAYQTRVGRFIKAFKLEEADRVPVMLPSGNFPAYYAGYDFRTIMYDYDAMKEAWIRFMDDFGDMDTLMGPGLVPCGTIAEIMKSKVTALPGLGLPETATMNQIIEGEYMFADEYDAYIKDPTDFQLRTMLPRTTGLFDSFKKLPPLRMLRGVRRPDDDRKCSGTCEAVGSPIPLHLRRTDTMKLPRGGGGDYRQTGVIVKSDDQL